MELSATGGHLLQEDPATVLAFAVHHEALARLAPPGIYSGGNDEKGISDEA